MAPITVTIKASNDKKYSIETDTEKTVLQLKQQIETAASVEPARQRLIYSGRVLSKDEETIETYKVKDGNTIHLVQSKAPSAAPENSSSVTPQIPMAAGTSASNPLEQLSGARYAGHNVSLPNASLFGPDGGQTGFGGTEDMSTMLEQPGVREAMEAAFSNPSFVEQMMNSNPQLRNAPPFVRQMLQSPEFRRQMLDPNFIRQANQMQRMMGGGPQQRSAFPAPGPAQGATQQPDATTGTGSPAQPGLPDIGAMMRMMQGGGMPGAAPAPATTTTTGQASAQVDPFQAMMQNPALMQQMSQMMGTDPLGGFGGLGSASPATQEPADTRAPEERYAEQLRQLNDMGFFEFDRNVNALRRAGGSVQGAIEALLNGSA